VVDRDYVSLAVAYHHHRACGSQKLGDKELEEKMEAMREMNKRIEEKHKVRS
jgi:hypothetical protein